MVMGRRFAAWRIAHDLGNHSLSFDVRDGVLEDDFHLLRILRKPGRNPYCYCRQYEPKEARSHCSPHCFTLTLQMSPPQSNAPPPACSKVTAASAGSYIVMHSPDSDFTALHLSLVKLTSRTRTCGGSGTQSAPDRPRTKRASPLDLWAQVLRRLAQRPSRAITSSARARTVSGTVRPRALA